MKKRIICSILLIALVSLLSINAYAKTFAWLISVTENKAQKIDVGNNAILKTVPIKEALDPSVELQDWEKAIIVDTGSNLLFVIYDYPGRYMGQGIKVYNLKDLTFKKDLGITSEDPQYDLPKLLIPPVGDKFYVIWWDSGSGKICSVYSKTTLTKINDLADFPIDIYRPWMFSSDGTKLYSLNIDTNEIKIYDSKTFALLSTLSFASIWSEPPLYGKSEEYYVDDKILFAENIRKAESDPNNFNYFFFVIPTKETSKKINVTEVGYGVLSNDGTKTVLIELMATGSSSANKIHIYNSLTGTKLKFLDLSNKYKSVRILKMVTISPDSSILYMMGVNRATQISTLLVIDLKNTYSVIAEIPSVEASRMIFFNE